MGGGACIRGTPSELLTTRQVDVFVIWSQDQRRSAQRTFTSSREARGGGVKNSSEAPLNPAEEGGIRQDNVQGNQHPYSLKTTMNLVVALEGQKESPG